MTRITQDAARRNVPAKGSEQAALYARARRIVARMRAARAARPAEFEAAGHPGPRSSWTDTPALAALAREARRVRGLLLKAARAQGTSAPSTPRPRTSRGGGVRPGAPRPASRRASSSSSGGGDSRGDPDPAGDHQFVSCVSCVHMFTAADVAELLCWRCWVDTRQGVAR